MDALNLPVRVVALVPATPSNHDEHNRTVRVPRPAWLGRLGWMAWLNFRSIIEMARWRPDLFMSGHIVLGPASWFSRALGIPVIAFVYATEVADKRRLASWSLRPAEFVVAISEHSAGLARSVGVPSGKIRVIHPGIGITPASPRAHLGSWTLLTVSRLVDRHKGHDVLLAAVKLLTSASHDVRLSVVGDGPLRQDLERLSSALDLDDRVRFHGSVSDERLDELYAQSDIFVMPSRLSGSGQGEGFGIVFLEASAHGLPVVAGSEGGTTDAVVSGETGILVDARSPEAVAEAIANVLSDPQLYTSLSEGGTKWAAAHAWPVIGRRYRALVIEAMRW